MLVIIPARFGATRFPGKPLADLGGKPVIQWVYERVCQAQSVEMAVVATDDERIFRAVEAFGGKAVLTGGHHRSGTDRCAEALEKLGGKHELVVNVQGDEPFVRPQQLDDLAAFMRARPEFPIGTLIKRIEIPSALGSPHVVKVVFSEKNRAALYFSRSAIPFFRDLPTENWPETGLYHKHLGVYAFRGETLRELAALTPSPLETAESLEQLRWLENGFAIGVCFTEWETQGIDTPEDLVRAQALL